MQIESYRFSDQLIMKTKKKYLNFHSNNVDNIFNSTIIEEYLQQNIIQKCFSDINSDECKTKIRACLVKWAFKQYEVDTQKSLLTGLITYIPLTANRGIH